MRKTLTHILLLILILALALFCSSCSDEESGSSNREDGPIESVSNTRAGQDSNAKNATVLIYMIASDLESDLYLGDDDGYTYFGCDTLVNFDKNGDLVADYDYSWVAFDGQIVPFYIISEEVHGNSWQATGYVPAISNADSNNELDINIYVRWDSDHEDGYIMGYTPYKHDQDTISLAAKNYLKLKKGDTLDFYCDFYNYDGEYDDTYYWGDTLYVKKGGIEVSYEEIDESIDLQFGYRLTDYYQNEYWTELLN